MAWVLLLSCFLVWPVQARQFHIWKDEHGVTHVSDQPTDADKSTAQGGRSVTLDPPASPASETSSVPVRSQAVGAPVLWPKTKEADHDGFDLSGVEWQQAKGYYAGKQSEETSRKFGYRAGNYRLEYNYKGGRHFSIWVHTRRGKKEQLVDIVRTHRGAVTFNLPKDDEVWFEVHSSFGSWNFTVERME